MAATTLSLLVLNMAQTLTGFIGSRHSFTFLDFSIPLCYFLFLVFL